MTRPRSVRLKPNGSRQADPRAELIPRLGRLRRVDQNKLQIAYFTEGNPGALAASRRATAAPSACLSKAALSAQTVPTYPSPVSRLTMLRREQNPRAALTWGGPRWEPHRGCSSWSNPVGGFLDPSRAPQPVKTTNARWMAPRGARGPSGVPMERNREHRTTRRRADSAPDPRDNARIPCSGRRALFLGCAPRNVWIGTLGTAQNAVIFTTGPSKILPGRLSSVCFEVQPRSGNVRSPNDPESGRRSAQVRPARCLTSFGRTTFFCDYGPFGPAAIGLNGK